MCADKHTNAYTWDDGNEDKGTEEIESTNTNAHTNEYHTGNDPDNDFGEQT